jgi:hypothetical protein
VSPRAGEAGVAIPSLPGEIGISGYVKSFIKLNICFLSLSLSLSVFNLGEQ